jgi:hypothetical protein
MREQGAENKKQLSRERSSKAAEAVPVNRPRHAQIPTKQNVGMVARFFVLDAKWVRIFFGHNAAAKEFSALQVTMDRTLE